MPIQVLPYIPSFIEQLSPHINQAAGAIGSSLGMENARSKLDEKIKHNQSILDDPKASPIQKVQAFSNMPESYKKSSAPVWAAILGPEAQSMANRQDLSNLGFDFNQMSPEIPTSTREGKHSNLDKLTDEQLVSMSALGGASEKLASGEMKRREAKVKKDEAMWNYKPTQDFIQEIDTQSRNAETAVTVADEFINLAQSGKISPSNPWNFIASQFGEKFPFLYTPETAQAKLLEKLESAGMKEIFPRPTEREFFFINSAQAQLGKSDAANVAVASLQKKFSSLPIKAAEFSQQVIDENGGVPPRNIQAKVREKMAQYRKEIFRDAASVNFNFGDVAQRKEAAKFLDTKGQNIPLTDEKKREIFKMAGNDPKQALKLAIDLGYQIPEE